MPNKPPKITQHRIGDQKAALDRMRGISEFDQEAVMLITLSADWRIIKEHIISMGGFHETALPLQVLFERVLSDKARFFLIGHNHTNGVGVPSAADIACCIRIMVIANIMDVGFVDSVIYPHGMEPLSMKSYYPNLFKRDYEGMFNEFIMKYIPKRAREV